METKKIVLCVLAFDPMKIQACLALKNVHHNLSFVKDLNVVGGKMSEMVVKWPTHNDVTVFLKQETIFKLKIGMALPCPKLSYQSQNIQTTLRAAL